MTIVTTNAVLALLQTPSPDPAKAKIALSAAAIGFGKAG